VFTLEKNYFRRRDIRLVAAVLESPAMLRSISSHVFLRQRLHPGLLDAMQRGGAQGIEIFAARHHVDYADRNAVRELANWFRSNQLTANSMHQPLYDSAEWSRHHGPNVNLIDQDKSRRIAAMDEVKRALEIAEQIPLQHMVVHLGNREDMWSQQALEHSLTAIEHLKAFAHPLGVKLMLENLLNDVTRPENLLEVLTVGHFSNVGICLDVGHANCCYGGVEAAFNILKHRIRHLHLHDNHGTGDEHLWPGDGTIDWPALKANIATLPAETPGVLEIGYKLEETAEAVSEKAGKFFGEWE
jgi:sugar phosphate isomerase/epimerase